MTTPYGNKKCRPLGKILLAAVLGVWLAGGTWAGEPVKPLVKQLPKAVFSRDLPLYRIEKILADRVVSSRARVPMLTPAQEAMFPLEDSPVQAVKKWPSADKSKGPYAALPFWLDLSTQAKYNYFLAANNRACSQNIRIRLRALEARRKAQADLWNRRQEVPNLPLEDLLVQSIRPDTQYILLGEEHDCGEVQTFVIQFLQAYKKAYPDKEIVLATEFLPVDWEKKKQLQKMRKGDPSYARVFDTARHLGMPVYGVEPKYVFYEKARVVPDPQVTDLKKIDLWILPEAMRLRNRFWLEQLQLLRQKHPNAVVILYAGMEHVDYSAPFSLSARLPAEKTYVAHIFPQKNEDGFPRNWTEEPRFDQFPFAIQKVLFWKDPALCHTAGFDMQLRITRREYPPFKRKK